MTAHRKAQAIRWARLALATFVATLPLAGPIDRHVIAAAILGTFETLVRQTFKTQPAATEITP